MVYKRGRRAANQPAQVERTDVTCQISSQGMEPHQENLTKKQRQLMTFVLITNVVPEKLDDHGVLFTYKGQSVVEVQFHLLKTPGIASQVFVKKPERILVMLRSHFIIFDGKQRCHGYCDSFQEERLITLLEFVDVDG